MTPPRRLPPPSSERVLLLVQASAVGRGAGSVGGVVLAEAAVLLFEPAGVRNSGNVINPRYTAP